MCFQMGIAKNRVEHNLGTSFNIMYAINGGRNMKSGPWSMRKVPRDTWLNRLMGHPVAMGYIRYPPIWHFVLAVPFGFVSVRVLSHIWEQPGSITESSVYVGLIVFTLPFVGTLTGMLYALLYNLRHWRKLYRLKQKIVLADRKDT